MKTVRAALGLSGVCQFTIASVALGQPPRETRSPPPIQLRVSNLPLVRTMDERFQSFQLGFSHLTGGDTGVSYENMTAEGVRERQYTGDLASVREPRAATDLSNPRFRKLVSALSPVYLRYGCTTTNTVYFQDNEEPKLEKAPTGHSVNFVTFPSAANRNCTSTL